MHQHTKVDEEIVIELLPHGLWNASFIPREHLPVNQKFDPAIIVNRTCLGSVIPNGKGVFLLPIAHTDYRCHRIE